MLVNGDQADRARGRGVAQPLDDPRHRQAKAAARTGLFGLDQLAVFGAMGIARTHLPFLVRTLVDGQDAAAGLGAIAAFAIDADDAVLDGADAADQPGLIVVIFIAPGLDQASRMRSPAPMAGSDFSGA